MTDLSLHNFPPFQISRSIYIALQSSLIGRLNIQLFCKSFFFTYIHVPYDVLLRVSIAKCLDIDSEPKVYENQQKAILHYV